MYKRFVRPLLFTVDPELIHILVSYLLKITFLIPGMAAIVRSRSLVHDERLKRSLFGLTFPNPVGLAAGFDKDARMYRELGHLGFGHVEVGTITLRPQSGNPRPRMFRLRKDEALINRMGFNNEGALAAVERLKGRRHGLIVGANIGKNRDTSNEDAVRDYEQCFELLADYVDYFVVNVSSPNTPGLRDLQQREPLTLLLKRLKELNARRPQPRPILLKIAPDLSNEQLNDIIEIVRITGIDGVIATNTTIDKTGLETRLNDIERIGAGGLSGRPLAKRSTEVIRYLAEKSAKAFPIIGVGGIHSPEDALEKLRAGADLIQLYTGFVYEGPGIVRKINQQILENR